MDARRQVRRMSVAVKLHRSVARLKNLSLGTVEQDNTQEATDGKGKGEVEDDRPLWTTEFPVNIVGYTHEDRANDLDGGFFEGFAILDYKHYDQIKQAEADANNQDKTLEKASEISLTGGLTSDRVLTKQEVESLYSEILYIVINQLGKKQHSQDSLTDGDIFVYAQEVLGITTELHRKLYALSKQKKPPDSTLKVTVKEAQNLEAKDANGYSDPYCMMSLIKFGEGDKPSKDGKRIKKIVLRDFTEEVVVRTTSIMSNTLNPVWNENFLFQIKSIKNEVLRIEIWDRDDENVFSDVDNKITSIKGFSGVGRFLKEVVQSTKCNESTMDDFLGLIEIPLKEVPSGGFDDWITLMARSSKSNVQGQIHIKLELVGSSDIQLGSNKEKSSASLKLRRQLWNQFIKYEARKYFEKEPGEVYWNVTLSPEATFILVQHASLNALTKFQSLVCEWEVVSKCLQDVPIPLDKFVDLTTQFKIYAACQDLDADEERIFIHSLANFVEYCFRLLSKYRHLYPASIPSKCVRLGNMLLCLMTLYKLPVFQNYYPEKKLTPELEEAVRNSTVDWFRIVEADLAPIQQKPKDELTSMVNLTNAVSVDLGRASSYLALFKSVGIDYFTLTFNLIEGLLQQSVKPRLEVLSKGLGYGLENEEAGTALFELYIALRDLRNHKEKVPQKHRKDNGVENYYMWFRGAVGKWLDLAKEKAIRRIQRALELDEDRVVHTMLKYSASAVDVTCCLGQICMFWKNLQWPDPDGAYGFIVQITDILSSTVTKYGEMVLKKLKTVGYFDTQGRFDVSEKLCISLNNLDHVLNFLDNIPNVLGFEHIVTDMVNIYGEDRRSVLSSTLTNVLQTAKDDMDYKLNQVKVQIGIRVKPEIVRLLEKITKNVRNMEGLEVIPDALLDYMDENLITLHESLLDRVFDRMLEHFWQVFLTSVEDVVKKIDKSKPERFVALSSVLEDVRVFFNADSQGLTDDVLHSKDARDVENLLYLHGAPSEKVIQKYFSEKCHEQAAASEAFGALEFKVFYSRHNQALHVSVIHARNLLPLDKTGSSDPFVTLELLPKHLFPNQQEKRTSIKTETLFPVFDENFSFEIPVSRCLEEGATLVLTVYDHDMLSDNDIAGEVFYDLNNVLGLEKDISGGFSYIKETEMPLIHGSLDGQPIQVLHERQDSKALAFIQTRTSKVRKMTDDSIRGRKISLNVH